MQPEDNDWVELPRQIYVTTVCHCDCCGQMVARRFLRQHHEARELKFCSVACAKLWREYWLPRYGGGGVPTSPAAGSE
ncbi:MAG: hypothetical protein ACREFP_15270 [Acetobacteraceae bacterium]